MSMLRLLKSTRNNIFLPPKLNINLDKKILKGLFTTFLTVRSQITLQENNYTKKVPK